jgi:hypothetical protein
MCFNWAINLLTYRLTKQMSPRKTPPNKNGRKTSRNIKPGIRQK